MCGHLRNSPVSSACTAEAMFDVRVSSWQEGEQLVKRIGGVFAFKVKGGPGGEEALWVVDVKNGKGSVTNDAGQQQWANGSSIHAELRWLFGLISLSERGRENGRHDPLFLFLFLLNLMAITKAGSGWM